MLGCNRPLFNLRDLCMSTNTIAKRQSKHSILNFELCSVVVLAAFAMGAASASHAQSRPTAGSANNAPSQMTPVAATGAIPANKLTSQDLDAAFNRADTNHDGKLNRSEAEHFPVVVQRFDQFDGNHDGFISRDEFNKAANE